ncbi:XRE family transcriptional regulator [Latilactobacillus sakei]
MISGFHGILRCGSLADLLTQKYNIKVSSSMIFRREKGAAPSLKALFIIATELQVDLNQLAVIIADSNLTRPESLS